MGMVPEERACRERGLQRAVLAGDEQAWRTWYDESFAGLYAYVRWRCVGLGSLTDDIVQETWLTAVRRIRCFVPEQGPFSAWLAGIAANLLRNHFRRQRYRLRRLALLNSAGTEARSESDRSELAERTAHALALLPERYEAVLRAKYLEEQTVNEIAASLDATPKAVESLLTRARQAFRDLYEKLERHHE